MSPTVVDEELQDENKAYPTLKGKPSILRPPSISKNMELATLSQSPDTINKVLEEKSPKGLKESERGSGKNNHHNLFNTAIIK